MDKDVIGIVGTLVGVLIGGLITLLATYLQLRKQEKQRQEERKIKAYEEIHKHLSIVDHQAGILFIEIAGKVKKEYPPDDKGKEKLPWQELEMLINFYTPELKEDFKIIKQELESLGRAWGLVIMEKYAPQETPDKLVVQAKQLSDRITEQVIMAKNKLSGLVNKIT